MAVESRRGCGFRKVGGLYLVSDSLSDSCHRLPIPAYRCPCCGAGFKQARGWSWVDPKKLIQGRCELQTSKRNFYGLRYPFQGMKENLEQEALHCSLCPTCSPELFGDDKAGLLWVGERFYKTTQEFVLEAKNLGVSRRIKALPNGFKPGETWVLLAHPKAYRDHVDDIDRPGIFMVFRPKRVEKILTKTMATPEVVEKLEKAGIVPVIVPDHDPDHQGSAYDKRDDTTIDMFSGGEVVA